MLDFFGWLIGGALKIFFVIAGLVISSIPNWVWYTIAALILSIICAHFWKQYQKEKAEEAISAKKREKERVANSIEAKMEAARKLQFEELIGLRDQYVDALNGGDIFTATANGRRYYALKRIYEEKDNPSRVFEDEVLIKNEVLQRKLRSAL